MLLYTLKPGFLQAYLMLACVCECVHVRDRPYTLAEMSRSVCTSLSPDTSGWFSSGRGHGGGQEAGGDKGPKGDLSLGPREAMAPCGT